MTSIDLTPLGSFAHSFLCKANITHSLGPLALKSDLS